MADQPTTPSGSRWEPDPDESAADETTAEETSVGATAAEETAAVDAPAAITPAEGFTSVDERRAQRRGRAILAGAATALTLGAGLAGFVIGHSTADDDGGLRPANFSRQGPEDGGQFGNGQPPGVDRDGGQHSSTSGNPT